MVCNNFNSFVYFYPKIIAIAIALPVEIPASDQDKVPEALDVNAYPELVASAAGKVHVTAPVTVVGAANPTAAELSASLNFRALLLDNVIPEDDAKTSTISGLVPSLAVAYISLNPLSVVDQVTLSPEPETYLN